MIDYKVKAAELFGQQVEGVSIDELIEMVEIPPNSEMGDYAIPCFKFAKILRKAPNMISEDISNKIATGDYFEKAVNTGPYVNFFVNKKFFAESLLKEVFDKKEKYGSKDIGQGRKVVVEFSSPNIAKPFHIGHIRTTVIGNSINKIYRFMGFDVVAINHLGDYGTQFGMLISAYKKWGDKEAIEANPIPELLKLYIKFNAEAEENEEYKDEARYWFKELENGNQEALELWQWIKDVSLTEFNRVYKMLNIEFDSYAGESFYSDKMPRVIKELEEKNLLVESQGAQIVDLDEFNMPSPLIKKSDGSTLYITRDIAASIYRKETYDFYKNIYVVGSQQNLHFQQWIKIVELMGYDWAKDCVHVPFGMVSLEEGTLSTRKGRVVFLEDVLNKAVEKTLEIINDRNPNLEDKEEVAKKVGIGAVLFQELYNNRIKDYTFSWEKTLSFEGETGPYVQYTYARTCSILRKYQEELDTDIDYSLVTGDKEFEIMKTLEGFSDIVESSMNKEEPFYITRFIVDLAQKFNRFYHNSQILTEDKELTKSRILLTYAVNTAIRNGLQLLGIETPERM
ncbi:arginyl-tRNA synthetase [Dethiosulfatibacter aminovorans DSM 17477]|uniref:Arginine--tRNA ligase n=1 Tax=Dethiosulfatibacter aminovorans DSM 17477 TaxID=1121476 RepID=A0A1M6GYI7_9FIRM|nr:arginine--tRNA ligase [Dethiosulfatibacter aminovorans]SHJ15011.1 arginyl-tRNA synthetase [Dethiosulfatibacter aminovorans DSM 17477]